MMHILQKKQRRQLVGCAVLAFVVGWIWFVDVHVVFGNVTHTPQLQIVPARTPADHACDDDRHACDQDHGKCVKGNTALQYTCDCALGFHCDPACNIIGHSCKPNDQRIITDIPTTQPILELLKPVMTLGNANASHQQLLEATMPVVNQPFISTVITNDWISRWNRKHEAPPEWHRSTRREVVIHPGLIDVFGMNGHGNSPKGELVQWASIISGLQLLGHNITVAIKATEFEQVLSTKKVDVIFTDYAGVRGHLNWGGRATKPFSSKFNFEDYYNKHKCRFLVADIYGTDQENNARAGQTEKNLFCCLGLPSVKQYLSWIPDQIPDTQNSFLGFANVIDADIVAHDIVKEKKSALVWGKEMSFWTAKGVKDYLLQFVKRGYTLYATMNNARLPAELNVVNKGSLSPAEYNNLLAKMELFIGLGDPLIGPSPIQALAYGCVYINPKFVPAKIIAGKPSKHAYTSQVPLLEKLGEPHVYTVEISNMADINSAIDRIATTAQVKPYIHPEFTQTSFLSRLELLVQHGVSYLRPDTTQEDMPKLASKCLS
eukprot:m.19179 g.19179  ORF g.19179 m.19179 type:complete len:546 (-) comp12362_c0_seq1:43-1680(-)